MAQNVNVNDAPIGVPSISGTAVEGSTLSASAAGISDADGLGAIAYQWLRGGAPIAGATSETYTLTASDIGAVISVAAIYTDARGTPETVVSAPAGIVAALPVFIPLEPGPSDADAPAEKTDTPPEAPPPLQEETNTPAEQAATPSQKREDVAGAPVADTVSPAPANEQYGKEPLSSADRVF